jgi:hypothetical protein
VGTEQCSSKYESRKVVRHYIVASQALLIKRANGVLSGVEEALGELVRQVRLAVKQRAARVGVGGITMVV